MLTKKEYLKKKLNLNLIGKKFTLKDEKNSCQLEFNNNKIIFDNFIIDEEKDILYFYKNNNISSIIDLDDIPNEFTKENELLLLKLFYFLVNKTFKIMIKDEILHISFDNKNFIQFDNFIVNTQEEEIYFYFQNVISEIIYIDEIE